LGFSECSGGYPLILFPLSTDHLILQVLSVAVSQAAIDAHPNGGLFIELSIIVAKKNADSQAAPVVARAAGRDMSAGWALIPWAELKAGTKTLNLAGGLPWSQLKIQPEDCGSRKGFFGLSKMQAPVSSITVKLDHAGEAAHFPDKCVCPKNAVPLLQVCFVRFEFMQFTADECFTAVCPVLAITNFKSSWTVLCCAKSYVSQLASECLSATHQRSSFAQCADCSIFSTWW
jgi:hypothetical protein